MNPITETIKSYFDANDWHYDLDLATDTADESTTDSDSSNRDDEFHIRMNGQHERIDCRIIVESRRDIMMIICSPMARIYPENMAGALYAMNEFNLHSKFVTGCVTSDGHFLFSLCVYTGGINIISEQTFALEFDIITDAVDNATAHIYKQALEYPTTPKRRSLFSFFKK